MKLITPIGLLATTALLAVYSVAAVEVALIERSWVLAIAAGASAVACVGTALMRNWSQYLVHLLTAGFVVKWCRSVHDGYRAGYFDLQFGSSTPDLLRSLLPGFTLIVFCSVCSLLVHRHFRRK